MKKMTTLLLLFISTLSFAQKIDGFGQIRLGKTYEQLLQDLGIDPKKVKDETKGDKIGFSDLYRPSKPVYIKYDPTKKQENAYMYDRCPGAAKLFLPEYIVADIKVNNIELSFFNDTLFNIKIDGSLMEFIKAFETKYGEGVKKTETKTVKCSSAFVKSFEETETTYTTTWDTGDKDIEASYMFGDYRDSKCQKQYISIFLVYNDKQQKQLRACIKATSESMKSKEDAELKAKLKDF